MSINQKLARFGLTILAAVGISNSDGATIGFEGTGVAPNGVISPILPYNEAGFVIQNGSPAPESGIFGADTDGEVNSGSDFLGWSFDGDLVLEEEASAPFTLNSFDAGHLGSIGGLPAVLTLEVTGHLDGGGVVMASFDYTVPWATFDLPATFTGLSSVEFLTSFDGGVGIDNIVVNLDTRPVPETGVSLTLLLLAVFALALLKAKKKKVPHWARPLPQIAGP